MEKRFKLYSIILAIVYFAMIIANIQTSFSGFKLGYNEGKNKGNGFSLYHIKVTPSEGLYTFPDLGINLKTGESIKLEAKEYMVYANTDSISSYPLSYKIIKVSQLVVSMLILAMVLYIPVLFIQIIRNVLKGKILIQNNIKRIARLGWILIIYFIVNLIFYGIGDAYANKQLLELPNYNIAYDFSDMTLLILGIVTLLFSEILRLSLKMKEEQDLTI